MHPMIKSRDWRKTPEKGGGGRCGEGPKQMRTREVDNKRVTGINMEKCAAQRKSRRGRRDERLSTDLFPN